MLTKIFKKFMLLILERSSADPRGLIPATGTNGTTYYLMNRFDSSSAFPYAVGYGWRGNDTDYGIVLGTGTTAPTEDDTALESIISGGLSVTVTQRSGLKGGVPFVEYNLAINNTGSEPVTISEIGYIQRLYSATVIDGTSGTYHPFLLDRTVMARPVTIPAGETGVIRYTLSTMEAET